MVIGETPPFIKKARDPTKNPKIPAHSDIKNKKSRWVLWDFYHMWIRSQDFLTDGDVLPITLTFYCPGSLGSWDFTFVGWKKIKIKKLLSIAGPIENARTQLPGRVFRW